MTRACLEMCPKRKDKDALIASSNEFSVKNCFMTGVFLMKISLLIIGMFLILVLKTNLAKEIIV